MPCPACGKEHNSTACPTPILSYSFPVAEETHDWKCGCGHWNGPNLAFCAVCGRKP